MREVFHMEGFFFSPDIECETRDEGSDAVRAGGLVSVPAGSLWCLLLKMNFI